MSTDLKLRHGLGRISLHGFKTIVALEDFELTPVTLLIGANGAGKSNLISYFRLLSWMGTGGLQEHVARAGGASALLHGGSSTTESIKGRLEFLTDAGTNEYEFRLSWAANDTLIFALERYRFSRSVWGTIADWREVDPGRRESALIEKYEDNTAKVLLALIKGVRVHQFHNTSETARMRQKWRIDDGRLLKEDGANLAPFLYQMQQNEAASYRRIVETIRLALPYFVDFVLEPEYGSLLLRWRERGSDYILSASQAADGMLRLMALVALLQQPTTNFPKVLILDEPELGLHPYAVQLLGGLIRSASAHTKILLATQSVSLVDQFEPEDIVVVDRPSQSNGVIAGSQFRRLSREPLQSWLEEYSLSELWEKNVVGGRPGA